jgi:exodeoxyribonuclease V alpha subunit
MMTRNAGERKRTALRTSLGANRLSTDLFSDSRDTGVLQGTLERIVYSNPGTGWSVARLQVEGRAETVSIVGHLSGVQPGESLRLEGAWVDDRRFGRQFEVRSFQSLPPSTLEGIKRYLGSGLIRGVGPVTAERIVEHFGEDTLRVLDDEPQRLRAVPGLGRVRAKAIRSAWDEQREIKDVMMFLQQHDVSTSFALRIYKRYGNGAIDTVTENPYRLAQDIVGVGFKSADRIAQALGIGTDSPRRLQAGVLHCLDAATDQGHCFLPWEELRNRAAKLLGIAAAAVTDAIDSLVQIGELTVEREDSERPIYTQRMCRLERRTAEELRRRVTQPFVTRTHDVERAMRRFETGARMHLSESQRDAITSVLQQRVLVITGGPGTGKTTLVRALLAVLEEQKLRTLLCAPTGRAAKRLATATRRDASTLHRLLEWNPRARRFSRNAAMPLDGDVFVVDEVSMVDLKLLHDLLQALPAEARLILVGDVDQLPSVGPGMVLADIIASKRVRTVRLQGIFRQAQGSLIVRNAHAIRQGDDPSIPPVGDRADFVFVERDDPETVLETPALRVDARRDIQVLAPMNRGTLGTTTINAELQRLLNPDGAAIGHSGLHVGDKVMQTRNNYALDVFNGDVGLVEAVDDSAQTVLVRFDDRSIRYNFSELDELVLAFACTVHKAQGSEYPVVVLVLHQQHHMMLQRNLLYTAVTRARQQLVILGQRRALRVALGNARGFERYTRLAHRLGAADAGAVH